MVRGKDETEKLVDELLNIKIPQYQPSTNHVKLFEKGDLLSNMSAYVASDG